MAQAVDSAYVGLSKIGTLTAEQRLYGETEEVLKITVGKIPLFKIMYDAFQQGGKLATTDMEFKYKCEVPRVAVLDVALASGTTNSAEDTIYIPEKLAPMVTVGTRLLVRDIFVGNDGTNYVFGTTRSSTNSVTVNEMIRVLQALPMQTNGGVNMYPFVVERNYKPVGSYTAAAATEITTSMKLILLPRPQAETDTSGNLYGDTVHYETAYNELNLEKWGQGRISQSVKVLQNETDIQRNGRRQNELFWKKMEWRQINGRMDTGVDANGDTWYTTGGLDEYIETPQSGIGYVPYLGTNSQTKHESHIVNFLDTYGALNYQTLNDFGSNKFFYGSPEKWWVMDNSQYTAITNSFDNKIRIMKNDSLTMKYGFKVSSLEISGGGTLHLVQSDAFSLAGITDLSYIVDPPYFSHTHLNEWDLTILEDVEKALNFLKQVNYMFMVSGIKRTNPFAFYKVFNLAAPRT